MEKIIKKIVLDIDGKEISLTPEQAQKLNNALNDMFGSKTVVKEKEYIPYRPYWPIREPYYTWTLSTKDIGLTGYYKDGQATLKI